jgi:flagellar protein FlbD
MALRPAAARGRQCGQPLTPPGWTLSVIYVMRLDGSQLAVNADLIETVEHTADTVITLIDGKRLVVATPVDEVVEKFVAYRRQVGRGALRVLHDERGEQHAPASAQRPAFIRSARRRTVAKAQAEED